MNPKIPDSRDPSPTSQPAPAKLKRLYHLNSLLIIASLTNRQSVVNSTLSQQGLFHERPPSTLTTMIFQFCISITSEKSRSCNAECGLTLLRENCLLVSGFIKKCLTHFSDQRSVMNTLLLCFNYSLDNLRLPL